MVPERQFRLPQRSWLEYGELATWSSCARENSAIFLSRSATRHETFVHVLIKPAEFKRTRFVFRATLQQLSFTSAFFYEQRGGEWRRKAERTCPICLISIQPRSESISISHRSNDQKPSTKSKYFWDRWEKVWLRYTEKMSLTVNIYLNIYLMYPKWKVGLAKNIYLDKTRNSSFIY